MKDPSGMEILSVVPVINEVGHGDIVSHHENNKEAEREEMKEETHDIEDEEQDELEDDEGEEE
jgi:hypothetical protein